MQSTASGSVEYASQKVREAKEAMREAIREKMGDVYDDAKQKIHTASDKASTVAHNVTGNIDESVEYGKSKHPMFMTRVCRK
ncbi:hypothetical protein RJT34_15945 [Clitoria ternatea]|uniref:Uncharacterized protein n=1 Tax=Clitoria ternatea TaxID=43366 RepID=A0AAN9J7G5_CLITE